MGELTRTERGTATQQEDILLYFADLHVHSKYSRATSKDCNLIELARSAALKGIRVVATGDFTHPAWRTEIRDALVEAEPGLFRLSDVQAPENTALTGGFGPGDVRFILNVEISSIYKRDGATRKVHNLIFTPDFDAMEKFSARLEKIGNIKSDGRPILGLDSRDLLEIALETSPDVFLIPAHVWTPWFSILGSRSGFDSVEECFRDLAEHIFALETGLSSDPEMNHRVSALDRFALISNSDTHSPSKLGRESNIFLGDPSYFSIRDALRATAIRSTGKTVEETAAPDMGELWSNPLMQDLSEAGSQPGFVGTIEFFPEEGKYHLDGHRKCGARLDPVQTEELRGLCPVCGHPVTVGVMNRVLELADRDAGISPPSALPFRRMLTLAETLGQAFDVGPQSKKVGVAYHDLLRHLGPELQILCSKSLEEIGRHAPEIVVEAIRRMRAGKVSIEAGFDGQYGTVRLFEPEERDRFLGQNTFLPAHEPVRRAKDGERPRVRSKARKKASADKHAVKTAVVLNEEQCKALEIFDRGVLVQAGPGTGKTRTLTGRVNFLIEQGAADPTTITAVTFTRKAAREIQDRLQESGTGKGADGCWVGTFHQLGTRVLETFRREGVCEQWEKILDEDEALSLFRRALKTERVSVPPASVPRLRQQVSLLKQNMVQPQECIEDALLGKAYQTYEDRLKAERALDLDDLVAYPVRLLREYPAEARRISQATAQHLLVDEFQDVNRAQYQLVRLLAGPEGKGLFAIGDPDQSIYGFRGADRRFFRQFSEDYRDAVRINLALNYRNQGNILRVAQETLNPEETRVSLKAVRPQSLPVHLVQLPNSVTEAEFIVRAIDARLGGASFFSIDSRNLPVEREQRLGFGDFAILFRLNSVGDELEKVFGSSDIPFQRAKKADPVQEAEALDPRAEAVTLMTIHAAKGLEFSVVFLAGCEEGIIPYFPSGEPHISAEEFDEERRLLYVAMTRAADELFLTRAETRTLHGRKCANAVSSFLASLNREMFEHLAPLAGSFRQTQKTVWAVPNCFSY